MARVTYTELKKKGLCVSCRKRNGNGKAHCDECLKRQQESVVEAREYRRRIHICPMCKVNKLYEDEKYCVECKAVMAERQAKYREIKENRDKDREYHRNRRELLKEQGLCTRCGKNRQYRGTLLCAFCRDKYNKIARLRYWKKEVEA